MTVLGTRPEIIRLSRTIARLDEAFDHVLVHTGQNHDFGLSQVFFEDLDIRAPDRYLGVDTSSLAAVLAGTLIGVEQALLDLRPQALLVLGDTNSSIAAVMAKRLQVPVYHMEAGNRSFDENVPEEVNRRLVDHIADFNLVYTEHARRNLLAEGLPARRIALTGSPMTEVLAHCKDAIDGSSALADLGLDGGGYVVASIHREENVDEFDRLGLIVETLSDVRDEFSCPVLVSTHPRTRKRLDASGIVDRPGIVFHQPFGFTDYVHLQSQALCVLSDSGTISEESAILGFPAVTLRNAIERPEALEAGTVLSGGIQSEVVRAAMRQVISQRRRGDIPPPTEYQISNCSQRAVNFIRSTMHAHHDWAGIRRRSGVWTPPAAGARSTAREPAITSEVASQVRTGAPSD
jgi:UDP-N-acetylglucosamine 2-epimerase (non-hydrolysing)